VKTDTGTSVKTLITFMRQSAKSQSAYLRSSVQNTWSHQSWRNKSMQTNSQQKPSLTPDEIEVRVWGFVVISVTLILCFIVVALLYSVTFVTQPIKSMAPIDQAYTKMLNDIVLLIVGGIGGVMSKRAVAAGAKALGSSPPPQPMMQQPMVYMPQPMGYPSPGYSNNHGFNASTNGLPSQPFGAMPTWTNPELDESWTPGPPPTTPPDHLEDDHERVQLAAARQEAD
jgi:hypothetical protein